MTPKIPPSALLPPATSVTPDEDRQNRHLLKVMRLAQALNGKEQELALVLLQTLAAWNGMPDDSPACPESESKRGAQGAPLSQPIASQHTQ